MATVEGRNGPITPACRVCLPTQLYSVAEGMPFIIGYCSFRCNKRTMHRPEGGHAPACRKRVHVRQGSRAESSRYSQHRRAGMLRRNALSTLISSAHDHLFICSVAEDSAFAEWLARKLTAQGYLVW
jgi:hypothetical protein